MNSNGSEEGEHARERAGRKRSTTALLDGQTGVDGAEDGEDQPGVATRDRTASSVFAEVSRRRDDDVEAVFDYYDVDSPSEVMAAEADPPEAAPVRHDPLIVGDDEEFDFGDLLIEERHEGDAFNWIATGDEPEAPASSGTAGPAAGTGATDRAGDDAPTSVDWSVGDAGSATGRAGTGTADSTERTNVAGAGTGESDAETADTSGADEGAEPDTGTPGLIRRFLRRVAALL